MWKIEETKSVVKQLSKAPREIQKKYMFWKSIAQADGAFGLGLLPGLKDHELKGEWEGSRSSRLNLQWRVIYIVDRKILRILVIEVNAHDYRKKG